MPKSRATEPHLFTSESVSMGHPDKVADQISDALLDSLIGCDPQARVAIETMVTTGLAVVAGEVTVHNQDAQNALGRAEETVRETIRRIGYDDPADGFDHRSCAVVRAIHGQSPDISQGVTAGEGLYSEQGAGDQGLMFGFACDETKALMPLPIQLAHRLVEDLAKLRQSGEIPWLRPDAKSQVTIVYEGDVGIKVANADGTNQTVVLALDTLPEGTNLRNPSWSPDGSMIVFESNLEGGGVYIIEIDLVTGEAIGDPMLVALSSGFRLHPAWSPDGFKIAYDDGFDIFLVNPDGTGNVQLTDTPLIEESHPTWSPTSDRIAVRSVRSVDNDRVVDIEVLEIILNGSMLVVDGRISLLRGSGVPLVDLVRITTLDWARGGDVIAFSGNGDIWVVPVADPRVLSGGQPPVRARFAS